MTILQTLWTAVRLSLLRIRAVLMKELVTLLKDPGVGRRPHHPRGGPAGGVG